MRALPGHRSTTGMADEMREQILVPPIPTGHLIISSQLSLYTFKQSSTHNCGGRNFYPLVFRFHSAARFLYLSIFSFVSGILRHNPVGTRIVGFSDVRSVP